MYVNSNICTNCNMQVLLCLTCKLYHICNVCFQFIQTTITSVNWLQNGCRLLHNGPHSNGHAAEAVGGGVLIPESNREGSEEAEVQSFVVPVANGIQLETRRRTRQQPTHTAQDVRPQMQPAYTYHVSQAPLCFRDISESLPLLWMSATVVDVCHCCGCLPLLWMSATAVDVCHCCGCLLLP